MLNLSAGIQSMVLNYCSPISLLKLHVTDERLTYMTNKYKVVRKNYSGYYVNEITEDIEDLIIKEGYKFMLENILNNIYNIIKTRKLTKYKYAYCNEFMDMLYITRSRKNFNNMYRKIFYDPIDDNKNFKDSYFTIFINDAVSSGCFNLGCNINDLNNTLSDKIKTNRLIRNYHKNKSDNCGIYYNIYSNKCERRNKDINISNDTEEEKFKKRSYSVSLFMNKIKKHNTLTKKRNRDYDYSQRKKINDIEIYKYMVLKGCIVENQILKTFILASKEGYTKLIGKEYFNGCEKDDLDEYGNSTTFYYCFNPNSNKIEHRYNY